ncbi:MAG: hypothetical protein IPO04_19610 [Cytophagaceae bacterium]|nr:hypothetical protein [Cytophagaceae bacterium]
MASSSKKADIANTNVTLRHTPMHSFALKILISTPERMLGHEKHDHNGIYLHVAQSGRVAF